MAYILSQGKVYNIINLFFRGLHTSPYIILL